ncbi:MAG TPA: hypothetical protein VK386_08930 [Acidimicrobiales bacterium]|nr:hypothetical protein [Acidimicrobiales bacterium]
MPTDTRSLDACVLLLAGVALCLYGLWRLVLLLHPAVVEGELIVEGEAAVVEAERIVRRRR